MNVQADSAFQVIQRLLLKRVKVTPVNGWKKEVGFSKGTLVFLKSCPAY